MIKFIKTQDKTNSYDITEIEFTVTQDDIALPELLEEFQNFLKACGYYLDNRTIEIVEEENESR